MANFLVSQDFGAVHGTDMASGLDHGLVVRATSSQMMLTYQVCHLSVLI